MALRQTGHTVLQMEEYTAEESRPPDRCVKDAASADLDVGIFAWRYGYVPKADPSLKDLPSKISPGKTSITEAEYHAAENIPRLIFLLADSVPRPPNLMDATLPMTQESESSTFEHISGKTTRSRSSPLRIILPRR